METNIADASSTHLNATETITETVEIEFAHQKISVKMTGEARRNREVVELVRSRLETAELEGNQKLSPHLVAVKGLFALAEEYVAAKRRFEEYRSELSACLPPTTTPPTH